MLVVSWSSSLSSYCFLLVIPMLFLIKRKRKQHLDKYSQQRLILGWDGQNGVSTGSVIIIGCGGLCSGCLPLLAGAGVKNIALVDDDKVEESNLHRQTIHTYSYIGNPKVFSAKNFVENLNPDVKIQTYNERVNDFERTCQLIRNFDVVVDCSDNMETRYLVNDCCVALSKPLVSASAVSTFGQLAVFWPSKYPNAGCYRCAFPKESQPCEITGACSREGVLGPVPSMIGCLQALETIKILSGNDKVLGDGKKFKVGEGLIMFDLENLQKDAFSVLKLRRRIDCFICSHISAEKSIDTLENREIQDIVTIPKNACVVDVRILLDRPFALTTIRVPMDSLRREFESFMSLIKEKCQSNQPIVCVCRTGITSRAAARMISFHLKRNDVFSLQGGVGN